MIYPGTDLKWKITCTAPGFTMAEDEFALTVRNRLGQTVMTVTKAQMLTDDDGGYYFTLPGVRRGEYRATVTMWGTDSDFRGGRRKTTASRLLCIVGCCGREDRRHRCADGDEGVELRFERVWWSNIMSGAYLCDSDGNPVLDAEGNPVFISGQAQGETKARLNLTLAELKHLLEERDGDGQINTVPEALDALGGLGEGSGLSVATGDDIDEMTKRVLGIIDN